jgi:long-chain acyl-CoA synthetase
LRQGVIRNDTLWDKLVFSKVRARLGGRVKVIITGAAPIAADVLDFLRAAFGCQVLEGYGQTETAAAVSATLVGDYSIEANGHVGAVLPCCEIKLVDIPDMGYTADDQPNPRGEICVRGYNVFKGYYKQPEKTKETLDADGWCHTGDVGMFLPNGTLKVIDRKKHLFKLSQGEYIAPEKIENVYVKSKYVAQVFIYGDSMKNSIVGIVVPDREVLLEWAKVHHTDHGWLTLVKDPKIKKMILDDMVALGKSMNLHSFEQVKDIHLETDEFTVENGLVCLIYSIDFFTACY